MTETEKVKNGKKEVVLKVVADSGGKLTLDDAVTKAKTLKTLKTANPDGKWRSVFGIYATVTTEDGNKVVTAKTT